MISVDAAALLAQVYPVGILVLALEARGLRSSVRDILWFRIYFRVVAVFGLLGILGGVASIPNLVLAVNENEPLEGFGAVVVAGAGFLMSASLPALLTVTFLRSVFVSLDNETET